MAKILIISSQIHKDLSARQLHNCLELFENSSYDYEVEKIEAGSYEIPYVISAYSKKKPFDAYIALGLVYKLNNEHYDYIMSHIKESFTHFALNNIVVGSGIISGASIDELADKIESKDSCLNGYMSAYKAVDALIKIQARLLFD